MPRGSNKGRTFAPETITEDEAQRLLAACSRGATGARNRALVALMYGGGLRLCEALQLQPEHVNVATGELRVRRGKRVVRVAGRKGRKVRPRDVAVNPTWAAVLAAWQTVRERRGVPASSPFICNLKGRRVLPSYVRSLCKRLAVRAGVDPTRVRPHVFRHSYAARLARQGVPVNVVQRGLGHSSIATTSLYLNHVADDALLAALRAAS
jgi:integrase